MAEKILITGASGMIGHMMVTWFKENTSYQVIEMARLPGYSEQVDFIDNKTLVEKLKQVEADIIINGAGMTVKESAADPASAVYLNSYLPHLLSKYAQAGKVIQLSSDCVFSGSDGGYTETSERNATDYYGRSKALGELENDRDLTIRKSLIGPELDPSGAGLLNWLLRQNGEISGYSRVLWSGVTSLELSKGIYQFIKQGITGIYHFTTPEKISKYHLLKLCAEKLNHKELVIHENSEPESDKSLVDTRKELDFKIASYETQLDELKKFMLDHAGFYQAHYPQVYN